MAHQLMYHVYAVLIRTISAPPSKTQSAPQLQTTSKQPPTLQFRPVTKHYRSWDQSR